MPPRMSVLLAVYNGGSLLKETIDSVIAQTHADFDFVIVDNGSTDDSVAVVLGYDDPRISLLEAGRAASVSECLNMGVAAARGEWIARIDADDPAHPQRLEMLLAAADQADGYGVISSDITVIFDDDRPTWQPATLPPPPIADLTRRLGYYNPIHHSST